MKLGFLGMTLGFSVKVLMELSDEELEVFSKERSDVAVRESTKDLRIPRLREGFKPGNKNYFGVQT